MSVFRLRKVAHADCFSTPSFWRYFSRYFVNKLVTIVSRASGLAISTFKASSLVISFSAFNIIQKCSLPALATQLLAFLYDPCWERPREHYLCSSTVSESWSWKRPYTSLPLSSSTCFPWQIHRQPYKLCSLLQELPLLLSPCQSFRDCRDL